MKRIFLMTVFLAFFIQTKAQVIDSVSVDSTKKEISYKKNELGIQVMDHDNLSFIGINYTRFLTKKWAIRGEVGKNFLDNYPSSNTTFNAYRVNVGAFYYLNQKQKGFYTGLNVDYVFSKSKHEFYSSTRSVFYVFPEIGYDVLIKKKVAIQPYIAPIGYVLTESKSEFVYPMIGLRLKYRF